MEIGSIADWVAALGGLASAGFGMAALRTAWKANEQAERVARDENERERKREETAAERQREQARKDEERDSRARVLEEEMRLREAERDQREQERDAAARDREAREVAAGLHAWWVKSAGPSGLDDWGVVVSNEAGSASVFHDVHISTTSNDEPTQLTVANLPPGRFFAKSSFAGGSARFEWPVPCDPSRSYVPIFNGTKHVVTRIEFRDPAGAQWKWTARGGLVRLSEAGRPGIPGTSA